MAPVFAQLASSMPMFALRVDRQLGTPILLAEGSIGMQRGYHYGIGPSVIPEAQLQLQLPRAIAPYLGVGAGAISGGYLGRDIELTTTPAIGVRVARVMPGSLLRIEARARGLGQASPDGQLELTTGMGWAF